jgi:hypothetical protein
MGAALYVYDNWSAYDELSDHVPLTEELAMLELEQVQRLKSHGVRIDAYLMDAFWYSRTGAYRKWKEDRWPNGPDRWLLGCRKAGLLPGLWFPANVAFDLDPPENWDDSLGPDGYGFSCYHGGFMEGYVDSLSHWYERGVRVFKFDFAEFGAAPKEILETTLPSEIRKRNEDAFRSGLRRFKAKCPEAILCAYNGFEEAEFMTRTDAPLRKVIDPEWLTVFKSIYVGDPRPADLPQANFWRTLDIYADHMTWYLSNGGLDLRQLDNCAFMIGRTGTCYRRGKAGWKDTLILSLARGGEVHMTLGNLEDLTDDDAKWFAKAQALFEGLASVEMVGGAPGAGQIYGYKCVTNSRTLFIAVNPALGRQSIETPPNLYLAYSDRPIPEDSGILELGSGGMVVLSSLKSDCLGTGEGTQYFLKPVPCEWRIQKGAARTKFAIPHTSEVHLVISQQDAKGKAVRSGGGTPIPGKSAGQMIQISAYCDGQDMVVDRPDDKLIWSGISWGYGILRNVREGAIVEIAAHSNDHAVQNLIPQAFFKEGS